VNKILSCPRCAAVVLPEESGGICPQCRTPVLGPDGAPLVAPGATSALFNQASEETRLAPLPEAARLLEVTPPPRPLTSSGSSQGTSSSSPSSSSSVTSGWLSSSGAIDHGRFQPGTLLGGRYRVVGRLGRGGMGEVYRADDLKLGQPVALKFLPGDVDRDPVRLTQLHTEVRMARQVSHPNVCRVYDIDETDGHTFLSMEYVDGEDLGSLLKRIGRFPEDRAIAVARQICSGLAAAHERGVVHRDFKPANVMIDSAGKVRITDFGLAGVSGEVLRAGTPAYMAPEQLSGTEVTARSDIYALGLVLYEVFTGQRALEGKNLAELIHKREQLDFPQPSALVRDLNPDIERAIMRCLEPDPAARPASALSVAAALPGGDPLAAALAAGETPSPEMVAAAGSTEALPLGRTLAASLWIALSLVAVLLLYQRVMLINRVPMPKPPEPLLDRAQEALARLGYPRGYDDAWGVGMSLDYLNFIRNTSSAPDRWNALRAGRPETFYLWYRTSPRLLVPLGHENNITGLNPPLTVGDMTLVVVDASGRLSEFHAVPQPFDTDKPRSTTDWGALFAAASLPIESFAPAAPSFVPVVFADERKAWEGHVPEQPDHVIRVEAGAFAGRPVYFVVTGPWSRSSRAPQAATPTFNVVVSSLAALIMPALMVAGALLARRNVKLGRGDRHGAFRAASFLFMVTLASWLLGASYTGVLGQDVARFFNAVGGALFNAALLWWTYLGLEPYVRRSSPDSLIGWTRLLGGRIRDPRVAVDILIGVCAGMFMTLLYASHNVIPAMFGLPEPVPIGPADRVLMGLRYVFAAILFQLNDAVSSAMLGMVGIVALRMLFQRVVRGWWAASLAALVIYAPVVVAGMFPQGTPRLDLAIGGAITATFILMIVRFGLLATVAALTTHFIMLRAPLTTDFTGWRGSLGLWYLAAVALLGFGAAYVARTKFNSQRPTPNSQGARVDAVG
jgi:tRNA A-37 threonylcarbamoyl transferase component Bud32